MNYLKLALIICLSPSIYPNCSKAEDSTKVVVAGGSLTEIIYFLNKESVLVGVDITSNFPEEAKSLPSVGYVRALSAEGILSLEPTLILGEDDTGPELVVKQIQNTGVDLRIIEEDYTLKSIYKKLFCVAKILNYEKEAEKIYNNELKDQFASLEKFSVRNYKNPKKGLVILNMEGTSPIVAGRNTSGNGFIQMLGAQNVVNDFEGWKPVGSESIIELNPDFIVVTKRGLNNFASMEQFIQKTSLNFTNAGNNENIYAIEGMAMLGFGPRTVSQALALALEINISE